MSQGIYNQTSLQVFGYQERPIPNRFLQHKTTSDKLALVFPGMGYTCDMPLLYYLTVILLNQGYDVLQQWSDYSTPDYQALTRSEQGQCLLEDGSALLEAGQNNGSYQDLLLAGKSMGTLTMSHLLSQKPTPKINTTVWFTPLLIFPSLTQVVFQLGNPAFFCGSEADPTFDPSAVAQLRSTPNAKIEVIQGANHSLEIPGNPTRSLETLAELMDRLSSFLTKSLP